MTVVGAVVWTVITPLSAALTVMGSNPIGDDTLCDLLIVVLWLCLLCVHFMYACKDLSLKNMWNCFLLFMSLLKWPLSKWLKAWVVFKCNSYYSHCECGQCSLVTHIIWRPVKMLRHHWSSGLALSNKKWHHKCC